MVERWGLLAGVTGVTGNLLLIALYAVALPGNHSFDWTGPANDVIGGIVSTGAMIPVALALRDLLPDGTGLRVATYAGVTAMGAIVVSSVLLVTDVIPFEVQVFVAVPAIIAMFAWVGVLGGVGTRTRVLPRGLARWATLMAAGALSGTALAGVALLLPRGSMEQYAIGGLGLLAGVPAYLAFPVWLIRLSGTLRSHLGMPGPGGARP
ncbi:hypothetical protein [Georgenia sp. AZ-5]|uniref:hypothetical protein n=1 Tax=Georgenia sp. AZ-5 TaxID=3367526 RepID=UPI0037549B5A